MKIGFSKISGILMSSSSWKQRLYDGFTGLVINNSKWTVTNPNTDVATFEQNNELIMNTLFVTNANAYANNIKSIDSRSDGCWIFTLLGVDNDYSVNNKGRAGLIDATNQNGVIIYRPTATPHVMAFDILQANTVKYTFTTTIQDFAQFKIVIAANVISVYNRVSDAWVQLGVNKTYDLGSLSIFMSTGGATHGSITTISDLYISNLDTIGLPTSKSLGIDVKTFGAIPDDTTDAASAINTALITGDVAIKDGIYLLRESIKIPSNRTVYLKNCKLRMADDVIDNFFRNSDFTGGNVNVNIVGLGGVGLYCDTALHADDHNTGATDYHTYGPLNLGTINDYIYKYYATVICNVVGFNVSGLKYLDYMHWNTLLQEASYGTISDIFLNQTVIGINQDGINVLWGSHHNTISNFRGRTGDDLIAFGTAKNTPVGVNLTNYWLHPVHDNTFNNLKLYYGNERGVFIGGELGVGIYNITFNTYFCQKAWYFLASEKVVSHVAPAKEDISNIVFNDVTFNSSYNGCATRAPIYNDQNCQHITFNNWVNNSGVSPEVINLATDRYDFSINGVYQPPAVFVSAQVADANKDQIVLTYDVAMDDASIPATSAFTPSGGKTVTNVAINKIAKTVTLTVDSIYAYGDVITIDYAIPGSNKLQGYLMGICAALTSQSVANNITLGWDTRALEIFANKLTADVVAYSDPRKAAINQCIWSLKGAGLFDTQFDVFVVTRGVGAGGRKLNWISDNFNAEAVANGGTLTETDDVGIHTDGTKSYLRTHFTPSSAGGLFSKDDGCFGIKLSGTITAASCGHGGASGAFTNCTILYGVYSRVNDSDALSMATRAVGYTNISRVSSSLEKMMVNSTSTDKSFNSTAITAYELFMLTTNTGGTPLYFCASTEVLEMYWIGKALTQAKFNTLQTIMNTYFASL